MGLVFDLDGIWRERRALESAMLGNELTAGRVRKLVREVVMDARRQVVAGVPFRHGDPRGARHAVRSSVYRRIVGANLNLYNSRKAGAPTAWEPVRRLDANPHQRGGNRVPRSARTQRMMDYGGKDRGFVLRWLNGGTDVRVSRLGHRGRIAARHWFRSVGGRAMADAMERLSLLIDKEIDSVLSKKVV